MLMDLPIENPINVLCLGPKNSGKTMLLKRLQNAEGIDNTYSAVPTIGTNIYNVDYLSRTGKKMTMLIREVGGEMSPLWSNYFDNIKKVIYVVDTSNLCQISAAAVLLYTILAEPKLRNAKFLIVLSKMDVAYRQLRNEALLMLQMRRLRREIAQSITLMEASAVSGQGVPDIHSWLAGNAINKLEK